MLSCFGGPDSRVRPLFPSDSQLLAQKLLPVCEVSIAAVDSKTKGNLGRKWFTSPYNSQVILQHRGKSGQELKIGA